MPDMYCSTISSTSSAVMSTIAAIDAKRPTISPLSPLRFLADTARWKRSRSSRTCVVWPGLALASSSRSPQETCSSVNMSTIFDHLVRPTHLMVLLRSVRSSRNSTERSLVVLEICGDLVVALIEFGLFVGQPEDAGAEHLRIELQIAASSTSFAAEDAGECAYLMSRAVFEEVVEWARQQSISELLLRQDHVDPVDASENRTHKLVGKVGQAPNRETVLEELSTYVVGQPSEELPLETSRLASRPPARPAGTCCSETQARR